MALAELAGDHTQQDIARTLNVSESTVTGWKEGRPPKPGNVIAAAKAYGVDALELMRIAYLSEDGEADPPAKGRQRKPRPDPNGPPL
jgi:transcriptional regulator with XRE-family HTH domain